MSEDLQSSYDRVAENYAEQFCDELDKKPFDRKMLDWLAALFSRSFMTILLCC